tara:strand:+ start:226 stop:621 length:396 start_codon:yes stop_codon:yes gene_type:complete
MNDPFYTTLISLKFYERNAIKSDLIKKIVLALTQIGYDDVSHTEGTANCLVKLCKDKDGLPWKARINTLYGDTRMFLLQDGKDAAFNGDGWREHANICRIFELTGDELLDALVAEFETLREQISVYSRSSE